MKYGKHLERITATAGLVLAAGLVLIPCLTAAFVTVSLLPEGYDENLHFHNQTDEAEWFVGTVMVVMRDGSHVSMAGLRVILQQRSAEDAERHSAVTNDAGKYHFRGLEPAVYHRSLEHDRGVVYSDSLFIDISTSMQQDTLLIPVDMLE